MLAVDVAALSWEAAGSLEVLAPEGVVPGAVVPEGVAVSRPLRRSSSQRVRSWRRSRLAWFQPCQHTSEAAPVNTARDPKAKSLCWGWVAWFQAAKRADPGQRPGRAQFGQYLGHVFALKVDPADHAVDPVKAAHQFQQMASLADIRGALNHHTAPNAGRVE